MGYKLWVNNERIGLSQPKKNGKYAIEVDFPVAQKVEISQKGRKKLSKARQKNQLMPPKDVRCSRGLAYFMKAQKSKLYPYKKSWSNTYFEYFVYLFL